MQLLATYDLAKETRVHTFDNKARLFCRASLAQSWGTPDAEVATASRHAMTSHHHKVPELRHLCTCKDKVAYVYVCGLCSEERVGPLVDIMSA